MTTSHGPFLPYIVRSEQQRKFATAERERRAASANPTAIQLPRWPWFRRWRASDRPAWFQALAHRRLQAGDPAREEIWPARQREHGDRPEPRLSS